MFVGAYWSQRKETREQVAVRIARFLEAIASKNKSLSTWLLKGRTKAQGRTELPLDPVSIGRALAVNRRDLGGEPIPEVGFNLSIWNGADVSLAATIGSFDSYVRNSVVLSFGDDKDRLAEADWRSLLGAAITAFDPEHGVVTSSQHLARASAKNAWDAGWFTYERGEGIREHATLQDE